MLPEVAPLQVRRTVFIPPTLRPAALSVIGAGVGVGVGVGLGVAAQYLPPMLESSRPAQTIISLPLLVHTAVCILRAVGALVVLVAVQLLVLGSYLPPLFRNMETPSPPQTIIS